MANKLLKKITMKSMVGDVRKFVNKLADDNGEVKDGQKVALLRVVGKCNRYQIKSTDLGDSVALKGQFEATSIPTGDTARAPTCYLPEAAAETIAGMLNGDNTAIEFGFDIGLVTCAKSVRGYDYEVTPLLEPTEDDALSRLSKGMPKLPKPVAAA